MQMCPALGHVSNPDPVPTPNRHRDRQVRSCMTKHGSSSVKSGSRKAKSGIQAALYIHGTRNPDWDASEVEKKSENDIFAKNDVDSFGGVAL
jgi:hypothetical protein